MVELVGTPADGLNAAIYKFEGKDFEAKMSVAAMLPGGIAATTAKYAKGLKLGDKLVDGAKILTKNADEVAEGAVGTSNLGKLTKTGKNTWESSAGLIYGADKKFGNRVKHVLAHGTPNPSKASHTIFNVGEDEILGLVDEAWNMKGKPLVNDPGSYLVNMGKTIGTDGEQTIKAIVKPGTSELITAYPVK